jgi:hypothetical protein
MIFRNFFRGKFQFSLTFYRGKISAEFSPKFTPKKMYEKSAPGVDFTKLHFGRNVFGQISL